MHNSYLAGVDSLPRSYNSVLRLAYGFEPIVVHQQNGGEKEKGVAFVRPGKVKKDLAESPECEEVATEKKVACFSCGAKDHMVYHCPKMTTAQRDTLGAAAKKGKGESYHEWKRMADDGTIHTNVSTEDFAYEEDGFGFLQSKSTNPLLQAQVEREQLNPDHLYLDSTSYFHQMFDSNHLDDVQTVNTILCGSCNAGTTFSNEKGWYMWLVRNSIANLLSLPQL